jgi:hypothetical protein
MSRTRAAATKRISEEEFNSEVEQVLDEDISLLKRLAKV